MSHAAPRYLLLALLALAAAGCDSVADETADVIDGPLVLRVVDQQVRSGPFGPPTPSLVVVAPKVQACGEQRFGLDVDQADGDVRVVVRSVPQQTCLASFFTPATEIIPLTVSAGTHRLRVVHDGETDLYTLTIAEDRLRLDPVEARVTGVPEPLAWRFPPQTFGFGCSSDGEVFCQEVLGRVERIDGLERVDVPAEGTWPFVRVAAYATHFAYDAPDVFFRYETAAGLERAKEAVRGLRDEPAGPRYEVIVDAWDGDGAYGYDYGADR